MAIHNTIEVMRPNGVMFFGGFFGAIIGVFIILVIFNSKVNFAGVTVGLLFGLALTIASIGCMVRYNEPPYARPTGKKQLEVTFIDDEIPVNFLDKYEVIEQRGEIFVLEEK